MAASLACAHCQQPIVYDRDGSLNAAEGAGWTHLRAGPTYAKACSCTAMGVHQDHGLGMTDDLCAHCGLTIITNARGVWNHVGGTGFQACTAINATPGAALLPDGTLTPV
jgi:hypothetical protein